MINLYSIRDKKMESFNRPFCMPADGAAIRAFQDEANNKDSELNRHPDDYSLFLVGRFDEDSGDIAPCVPMLIAEAQQLIYRDQKE